METQTTPAGWRSTAQTAEEEEKEEGGEGAVLLQQRRRRSADGAVKEETCPSPTQGASAFPTFIRLLTSGHINMDRSRSG